jgi:hypothetical protein
MKYVKRLAMAALILVGAGGLAGSALAGEVYTWTDENGVVHFTDREPVGRDAEVQNLPDSMPPSSPSPYAAPQAGKSAAQQRREDIQRKGEESQARQAMTDRNCQAWQAEVARLEPNRRVFYTNEQGETERMDDVARANRVAELKSKIAQNCR